MKTSAKAIVFDLDGTLIPTMEGFADIAAELIREHYGWDLASARKAYIDTSGIPFCKQLEVLFPGDGRNGTVSAEFERRKLVNFFQEAPSGEVLEMLRSLQGRQAALAVSSNNYADVVQKYASIHFEGLFDLVLGFREGFGKGAPHFKKVRDVCGVEMHEILFVADSLSDLKLAKDLGVNFVGVEGIFRTEDFRRLDRDVPVLTRVSQLGEFLRTSTHTA